MAPAEFVWELATAAHIEAKLLLAMHQKSLTKYHVFYLCTYSNALIQPGCCPGLGCVPDLLPALSSAARDEVAVRAERAWSQLALVTLTGKAAAWPSPSPYGIS